MGKGVQLLKIQTYIITKYRVRSYDVITSPCVVAEVGRRGRSRIHMYARVCRRRRANSRWMRRKQNAKIKYHHNEWEISIYERANCKIVDSKTGMLIGWLVGPAASTVLSGRNVGVFTTETDESSTRTHDAVTKMSTHTRATNLLNTVQIDYKWPPMGAR